MCYLSKRVQKLSQTQRQCLRNSLVKLTVSNLTFDRAQLNPDPHFLLSKKHNVVLIMNSPVSPVLNTGALSGSTALYKLSIAADSRPAGSVPAASILLSCNGIIPLMQFQLNIHYSAQVSKQTVHRKPPPGTHILGKRCVSGTLSKGSYNCTLKELKK